MVLSMDLQGRHMKLLKGFATLCLVASASLANAQSCSSGGQTLGEMGPPGIAVIGNSFSDIGEYSDCYKFQVDSSAYSGLLTFEIPSIVTSVSLESLLGSSAPSASSSWLLGHSYTFSSLAGGVDYTLKIVSTVVTAWGGGYLGVLSTHAAPVPEPSAVAMLLLGLLGLGFAVRRNSR